MKEKSFQYKNATGYVKYIIRRGVAVILEYSYECRTETAHQAMNKLFKRLTNTNTLAICKGANVWE